MEGRGEERRVEWRLGDESRGDEMRGKEEEAHVTIDGSGHTHTNTHTQRK